MIALVLLGLASAHAASASAWGGLSDTAGTTDAGDVVVRLPHGRSSVGLTPNTELQVVPFDIRIGGTRIAVEQVIVDEGPWTWSLAPSIGEKWSGRRTSLRLDSFVAWTGDHHRANLGLASNARVLRQLVLGDERSHELMLERVDVPLTVSWDWLPEGTVGPTIVRVQARTPLHDEGEAFNWASMGGSWIHRMGKQSRLYMELGAAVLVGRPSEHVFLGTYDHLLVIGYPKLDIWMQF